MTVAAEGSRYFAVTPPAGLPSVALRVTGPLACLPAYIDADGRATSPAPVFRSSAEWGTVHVNGRLIIPTTTYIVFAEVTAGTPIGSGAATTWLWGDANNANGVDLFDILCVLDGSKGVFTHCTLRGGDLLDFTPDGAVNAADVNAVLESFQSLPYPDSNPCAGR
jgi:hypothetical protein